MGSTSSLIGGGSSWKLYGPAGTTLDLPWYLDFDANITALEHFSLTTPVDAYTQHLYSLGPGVDPRLSSRILNATVLDELNTTKTSTAGKGRTFEHALKARGRHSI